MSKSAVINSIPHCLVPLMPSLCVHIAQQLDKCAPKQQLGRSPRCRTPSLRSAQPRRARLLNATATSARQRGTYSRFQILKKRVNCSFKANAPANPLPAPSGAVGRTATGPGPCHPAFFDKISHIPASNGLQTLLNQEFMPCSTTPSSPNSRPTWSA